MSSETKPNKNDTKIQHTIEDVESLINNVLVLSTLTLAFAFAHLFGSTGQEEQKDILNDLQNANIDPTTFKSDMKLMSLMGWLSVGTSSSSLLISCFIQLSLNFSDCREDNSYFSLWFEQQQYMIGLVQLLFMFSIAFFCQFDYCFKGKQCLTNLNQDLLDTEHEISGWSLIMVGIIMGITLIIMIQNQVMLQKNTNKKSVNDEKSVFQNVQITNHE